MAIMDEKDINSQDSEQIVTNTVDTAPQQAPEQVSYNQAISPVKKSKIKILIAVLIVLILGISSYVACYFIFAEKPEITVLDAYGSTPVGITSVVNANNSFAFDLYSEYKDSNDNIFFSPYSISSALAMTYEGASGKTAEQMQSVFGFPSDATIRRPSYASIYNQLNKADSGYTIGMANALWVDKKYTVQSDYLDVVSKYYGGQATNVDFKNETEKTRGQINKWVEDKTNNKIKDLFPMNSIQNTTKLVLANAIYFKGSWLDEFNSSQTEDRDFKTSSNKKIQVPTMSKNGSYRYYEDSDLQAVKIPYKSDKMSMMIILPKDGKLEAVEKNLSVDKLSSWDSDTSYQQVDLYIPKFKVNTSYTLTKTLKDMGMPLAFSNLADFSKLNMDKDNKLKIDIVVHKAYVDVNEEGTEAAAATGVGMMRITSVAEPEDEPKVFRADHPFIFLIRDTENGNILFAGRINDPTL